MLWLKQSTAVTVKIGPFLDEDDGKTAETALTLSQGDIRLSKNGGNLAQKNESSSCTHDELGIYDCDLDTTDTGTLGRLQLFVHESGALPVWHEFMVVPANTYDSLVSGSDYLQADAVQVEGSDATDQINAACDTALSDYDAPTDAEMDAAFAALNDPTAAAIADQVWDEPKASHAGAGTFGEQCGTDIDAILTDTNAIETKLPSKTYLAGSADADGGIDATEAAVIQSECNDALVAQKLDHLVAVADSDDPVNDSIVAKLAASDGDWSGFSEATDSLEAIRDNQAGADASAIADAVWEEAIADHSGTGGSTAEALDGASAPSAATVADAVWDEALSAHDSEDSVGNVLNDLTEESGGTYRFTSGALGQAPTGGAGSGAITWVTTIQDGDTNPIVSADVWATSDEGGSNVLASGQTNSSGQVTFYLDAGTVYMWVQKEGYNFTNPTTVTVA